MVRATVNSAAFGAGGGVLSLTTAARRFGVAVGGTSTVGSSDGAGSAPIGAVT